MPKDIDKITTKEITMVENYLANGFNMAKAFGDAYETKSTQNAYRAFNRPRVQEYLESRRKELFDTMMVDSETVMGKLAQIAFAPKGDDYYNAQAQLKALDLLQKQLGLQRQKLEAEVNTDINITIEE